MMIGEFEYGDTFNGEPDNYVMYPHSAYILFVCFVIVMAILIMNLLVSVQSWSFLYTLRSSTSRNPNNLVLCIQYNKLMSLSMHNLGFRYLGVVLSIFQLLLK